MAIENALSIDLEDWYHPELVRKNLPEKEIFSQIEKSSGPILELLAKYKVRATFFILGQVAEEAPALINRIYEAGHEIASHGMSHRPLWELNKGDFSKELGDFRDLIKKIIGKDIKIKGFRAPSFSLDNSTKWALEVLKEKGYAYDSSIFPMKNKLYGLNGAPLKIYRPSPVDLRKDDDGFGLLEFPLTIGNMFGVKVPVAGGFYFRVIPFLLFKNCLRKINYTRPFVFYLHPWESYYGTPRVKGLSAADHFITYWGTSSILRKFEDILKYFSFKPICEVLGV